MIKVNEFTIYCDVIDIVEQLVREGLLSPNYKEKGDYISICCPYHGEKNASSSITTHEIVKSDKIVPSAFFNCFACHSKGNLFEFV